jgi:hypothetical protein
MRAVSREKSPVEFCAAPSQTDKAFSSSSTVPSVMSSSEVVKCVLGTVAKCVLRAMVE